MPSENHVHVAVVAIIAVGFGWCTEIFRFKMFRVEINHIYMWAAPIVWTLTRSVSHSKIDILYFNLTEPNLNKLNVICIKYEKLKKVQSNIFLDNIIWSFLVFKFEMNCLTWSSKFKEQKEKSLDSEMSFSSFKLFLTCFFI